MQGNRPEPPPYPDKLTVALLGNNVLCKNQVGNLILNSTDYFNSTEHKLVIGEANFTSVINTPDFFDEDCANPDQRVIDFMAFTCPGPDYFLLVIDSKSSTEEQVVAQISKLQDIFGAEVTKHLVVLLPDIEVQKSLKHLKELFDVQVVIATDRIHNECKSWRSVGNTFTYNFTNYSKEVVLRRKAALEKRRANQSSGPVYDNTATIAHMGQPNTFNFVFLGLTGSGKSASANTILATGRSNKRDLEPFVSRPSSVPITTRCESRFMKKPFGIPVLVVDTPDFFNDEVHIAEEEVSECRRFCHQGSCVVLLVIQLGRFTNAEIGILERLEHKIGWKIRKDAILLLTHKDDLDGSLSQYIYANPYLKNIAEMCSNRFCAFNNKSKDIEQVYELVKKIPNYQKRFPQMEMKRAFECLTS